MQRSGPLSPDRPAADEPFRVEAPFDPAGDQPGAIERLVDGFQQGIDRQTLLGVTGSGKTNTVSWVMEELQQPTLLSPTTRHSRHSSTRSSGIFFQITR